MFIFSYFPGTVCSFYFRQPPVFEHASALFKHAGTRPIIHPVLGRSTHLTLASPNTQGLGNVGIFPSNFLVENSRFRIVTSCFDGSIGLVLGRALFLFYSSSLLGGQAYLVSV